MKTRVLVVMSALLLAVAGPALALTNQEPACKSAQAGGSVEAKHLAAGRSETGRKVWNGVISGQFLQEISVEQVPGRGPTAGSGPRVGWDGRISGQFLEGIAPDLASSPGHDAKGKGTWDGFLEGSFDYRPSKL